MAPSATDYVHGLRRMWWIPLIALLVGVGLGVAALGSARATTTTNASALFTFRVGDAGQESAGSARGAEALVAQSRLAAYVQIVRSSQELAEILEEGDIKAEISTAGYPNGANDASTGIVEVQIANGDLGQTEAADLVRLLTAAMIDEVQALDAQQDTPSLRPDVLLTEPQSDVAPPSRVSRALLPGLVLLLLGLGVVYLLVWRQDRIHGRRDIVDRLGARVLGDMDAQPADAPAIALALRKGRHGAVSALLVPAGRAGSEATSQVGRAVTVAGRDLGLDARWSPVGPAGAHGSVGASAPEDSEDPDGPGAASLTLLDGGAVGLNSDSLHAAARVDIVALIVEYGVTTYGELSAAGRAIAEITEAEIAVIGVRRGRVRLAQPNREPRSRSENPKAAAPK